MDYNQRIKEIGNGKNPPKKLADIIEDYEATKVVITDLNDSINAASEDEDVQQMQSDLQEIMSERDRLEIEIEKRLVSWEKGIGRMKHMHETMKNNTNNNTNIPSKSTSTGTITSNNGAFASQSNDTVVEVDEQKKKGGYGWILFGGMALILTLGAVNVMKNK